MMMIINGISFRITKPEEIPRVFKGMRIALGMTQRELAQVLDCQSSTISNYECRRREVSFETLLKVSRLLHLEMQIVFIKPSKQ